MVLGVSAVYLANSLLYVNMITMLAVGLTLTYLTTKVPNFAHGTLATIGAYAMFTVFAILMKDRVMAGDIVTPMVAGLVFAAVLGAVAGLAEYILVLRPLKRRGATPLALMIATLGVDVFAIGLLNIYADILQGMRPLGGLSRDFMLRSYFVRKVAGLPLGLWVSYIVLVGSLLGLYLLLTRTRFGVAMRASIENPQLAQVLGVNVDLVNMASWVLAGFMAGLAGGLMLMNLKVGPVTGSDEVVSVFAASIVGGLQSLWGAVLGGYTVGLSATVLTQIATYLTGFNFTLYKRAVPLILIIIVLLVAPEGLAGSRRLQALWERIVAMVARR